MSSQTHTQQSPLSNLKEPKFELIAQQAPPLTYLNGYRTHKNVLPQMTKRVLGNQNTIMCRVIKGGGKFRFDDETNHDDYGNKNNELIKVHEQEQQNAYQQTQSINRSKSNNNPGNRGDQTPPLRNKKKQGVNKQVEAVAGVFSDNKGQEKHTEQDVVQEKLEFQISPQQTQKKMSQTTVGASVSNIQQQIEAYQQMMTKGQKKDNHQPQLKASAQQTYSVGIQNQRGSLNPSQAYQTTNGVGINSIYKSNKTNSKRIFVNQRRSSDTTAQEITQQSFDTVNRDHLMTVAHGPGATRIIAQSKTNQVAGTAQQVEPKKIITRSTKMYAAALTQSKNGYLGDSSLAHQVLYQQNQRRQMQQNQLYNQKASKNTKILQRSTSAFKHHLINSNVGVSSSIAAQLQNFKLLKSMNSVVTTSQNDLDDQTQQKSPFATLGQPSPLSKPNGFNFYPDNEDKNFFTNQKRMQQSIQFSPQRSARDTLVSNHKRHTFNQRDTSKKIQEVSISQQFKLNQQVLQNSRQSTNSVTNAAQFINMNSYGNGGSGGGARNQVNQQYSLALKSVNSTQYHKQDSINNVEIEDPFIMLTPKHSQQQERQQLQHQSLTSEQKESEVKEVKYQDFIIPTQVVLLLLQFNFDEYVKYLRLSATWFCAVNDALDDYAHEHLENGFLSQGYLSYLNFIKSYNLASPIEFCGRKGVRIDRMVQCEIVTDSEINSRQMIGHTMRIGYSHQYMEQKESKDNFKNGKSGPTRYNTEYRVDIIKKGQKRITWVHLSDDMPPCTQNELQLSPGDLLEFGICLYNLNGLVSLPSFRWDPPLFIPIPTSERDALSYNRDILVMQHHNDRKIKVHCNINRICEVEDAVPEWILNKSESLQARDKPRMQIDTSRYTEGGRLQVDKIYFNELDIHFNKIVLNCIKRGLVKISDGLEIQIRGDVIKNEIKKRGVVFDRNKDKERIQMRVGDILVVYNSVKITSEELQKEIEMPLSHYTSRANQIERDKKEGQVNNKKKQ